MKVLEKIFLRLSDREQNLLVISIVIILLVAGFKILQTGLVIADEWSLLNQTIAGHETVISLKPAIDKALEIQKEEQRNKSYDKKNLGNRASSLADKVFPQRDYRELKPIVVPDRYSQHRVQIEFDRASYGDVNEFASLIRQESPFMFLSEVKIVPNYPPKSRPYDPTTFDASFEVSSVEFNNQ